MRFLLLNLIYSTTMVFASDPDKFTICAITINSDNERRIFEEQVKKYPAKFNPIVELTEMGEDDWFEKACESGIRCDQLLISGHFGGTFFSMESEKELSLSTLEKKGCSKSCEGILSHPYEVFLMGCNTLSTKEADHRSPEQYLQVLLADGISGADAERVVQSRYGITGSDHRSQMMRSFSGEKKQLYGFDSVGPTGDRVESFLKNYFSKINFAEHMEQLQAKRMMDKVDFTNKKLADSLSVFSFTQCETGDFSNDEKMKIICGLIDEKLSTDKKIEIVQKVFRQENYLEFVPSLNNFFSNNKLTSSQRKELSEISTNEKIRSQIIGMIKDSTGINLTIDLVSIAENLDFLSEEEGNKLISNQFNKMFDGNIDTTEKDIICSMDIGLINIQIDYEKINKLSLKTNDYRTLFCLSGYITDQALLQKIAQQILSANQEIAQEAMWAVSSMKNEIEVPQPALEKLIKDLNHPVSSVRSAAVGAFSKVSVQENAILRKISEKLNDPDEDVVSMTIETLRIKKVEDPSIHTKIATHLLGENETYWYQVFYFFQTVSTKDTEIQLKLTKFLIKRDVNDNLYYSSYLALRNSIISDQIVLDEIKKKDLKLWEIINQKNSKGIDR